MRAIVVERFGSPGELDLRELPDPAPRAGELLIDVAAVDVLWLETALRGNRFGEGPMTPALPWTPGNGVVGRVAAAGDGVDGGWVGRRVGAHTGNRGGYAERVCVATADAVPVPDQLGDEAAAALLHDGVTALILWEVTHPAAGDAVLVAGASGGLGLSLLQLAAARTARVVALARGDKARRISQLDGEVVVVDTDDPGWPGSARTALGAHGADVVFDGVGAALGEPAFELLARGGRMSSHGAPGGGFTEIDPARVADRGAVVTGIDAAQPTPLQFARLTARAFDAAVAGELAPVVGQTYALADAAGAHAAIEARTVFGKTLLTTD